MRDRVNGWQLVVPTGGDAVRQERLTRDLYETLRSADGVSVGFDEEPTAIEPGHKGAVAADVALWTAASLPAARVLITLIKEWCAKERQRSVKLSSRGRTITITGRPDAAQERMVRDFLDAVDGPREGRAE